MTSVATPPVLLVNPDKERNYKAAKRTEGNVSLRKDIAKEAAMLRVLDSPDWYRRIAEEVRDRAKSALPGAPLPEIKSHAKQLYGVAVKDHKKQLAALRVSLRERVEKGGAAMGLGDVIPTEEQQLAIQSGKPWRYNRLQATRKLLDEDEEGYAAILSNQMSPEQRARLDALMAEEQMGAPGKGFGIGKAVDDNLRRPGVGASAAFEAAKGSMAQDLSDVPAGEGSGFDVPVTPGAVMKTIAEKLGGPEGVAQAAQTLGDAPAEAVTRPAQEVGATALQGLESPLPRTGNEYVDEYLDWTLGPIANLATGGPLVHGLKKRVEQGSAPEILPGEQDRTVTLSNRFAGIPLDEAAKRIVAERGISMDEALALLMQQGGHVLEQYGEATPDALGGSWMAQKGKEARQTAEGMRPKSLLGNAIFAAQDALQESGVADWRLNPERVDYEIRKNISKVDNKYKLDAIAIVKQKYPDLPIEQKKAKAKEIHQSLMASDMQSMDPAIVGLVQEIGLDPSTYFGAIHPMALGYRGGKAGLGMAKAGIGAGIGKLAEMSPGVAKAVESAEKMGTGLGRGMEHLWDYRKFSKAGEKGEDVASMLRADNAMADVASRQAIQEARVLLQKMGTKTDAEAELVARAIMDPAAEAALPSHLRPQFEAAQDMAKLHAELREASGAGQRFDSKGNLLPARTRQRYMPEHLKVLPDKADDFDRAMEKYSRREGLPPPGRGAEASAYQRTGSRHPTLLNPQKQWEEEWFGTEGVVKTPFGKSLSKNIELKGIEGTLRGEGWLLEYERPVAKQAMDTAKGAERGLDAGKKKLAKLERRIAEQRKTLDTRQSELLELEHQARRRELTGPEKMRMANLKSWTKSGDKQLQALHKSRRARLYKNFALEKKIQSNRALVEKSVATDTEIRETVKRLKKETGMDWAPLDNYNPAASAADKKVDTRIGEVFRRVTGKPGQTTKAGAVMIVPEPVHHQLYALTGAGRPPSETLALWNKFNSKALRPFQTLWRGTHTLLSLPYYMKNLTGAFGLSTIAHGAKALSPKLQGGSLVGALASASMLPKVFDDAVRAIPYRLRSGRVTNLGRILESAQKIGAVDIADFRLGLAAGTGKGPLGKAMGAFSKVAFDYGNLPGISKLSPRNVNRAIDNYQHLVAYMGFLDDLTPKGIARAADLTAKFAGDYRRLGTIEKGFLRDGFGFYAWYRFIFPHVIKQLGENPHRFAAWAKTRHYFENKWGDYAPVFAEAMPQWTQGFAVTAPPEAQGREKGPMKIGSHEFAIATMEDPTQMGLSLFPGLVGTFTGDAGGQSISDFYGPLVKFAVEASTKSDLRTGEPLPEILALLPKDPGGYFSQEFKERWYASHFGRLVWGMAERPSSSWMNLVRLYSDNNRDLEAVDMQMRLKAGRDFLGLDHLVAKQLGVEPRSLGGAFQTGNPLMTVYGSDAIRNVSGRAYRAKDEGRRRRRSLERAGE